MSNDDSRRQAGLLHWAGRWQEAAEAWRHILATEPADGGAWLMLGVALARLGRSAEGVEALHRGLLLHPGLPAAWRRLASLAAELGDQETEADAWLALGQQADERGESVEALAAYSRAVALRPDLALVRHRLAELEAARGNFDAAISELRQLAGEEAARGDRPAMERTLQLLLRIDPANTWAGRQVQKHSAAAAVAPARPRGGIRTGARRPATAASSVADDTPLRRAVALRQAGKLEEAARFVIEQIARAEGETAPIGLLEEATSLLRLLPQTAAALAVELAAAALGAAVRRGEGEVARRVRQAARASLGRAVAEDPEDLLRLAVGERTEALLALREAEAELSSGRREAAFDLLLGFVGKYGGLAPAHRLLHETLQALGTSEYADDHGRALATLRQLRRAAPSRSTEPPQTRSPSPGSDG